MSALAYVDENGDVNEVVSMFEREVGVTGVPYSFEEAGHRRFINFKVGKDAPIYRHALFKIQQNLPMPNEFRGAAKISISKESRNIPNLTRSKRAFDICRTLNPRRLSMSIGIKLQDTLYPVSK